MKTTEEGSSERSEEERRHHPRLPIELEVSMESEHNFFMGFTENLSEGGLFVATHQRVEMGSRFRLVFTLAGTEKPIEVMCEVRWIRPYHEGLDVPPGLGVRFLDLGEEEDALIKAFIRSRSPIFFDD